MTKSLATSYQVTNRLLICCRDPHRSELASSEQPGQLLRIAPVRLHAIGSLDGNQPRRDYLTHNTQFGELALQRVTARSRFVAGADLALRA
jgi:hypothetical protein